MLGVVWVNSAATGGKSGLILMFKKQTSNYITESVRRYRVLCTLRVRVARTSQEKFVRRLRRQRAHEKDSASG